MFNSCFNNTFPIFYDENNNDINLFSYYDHIQSPLNDYDMESYTDFLANHGLIMTPTPTHQEPFQGTNSSVATEGSSILLEETSNKIESNKGDEVIYQDEMVIINKPCKRKRTCNKDRHSKIRTAHGLRDRRMRLSLEVARPFFKLQDMLGYDKASKTVEWLLTCSKTAIDELYLSKNGSTSGVTKCTTISSTSDCEGESIVVEQNKGNTFNTKNNNDGNNNNIVVKDGVKKNKKKKRMRRTKEDMNQAREKARKRTLEKLLSRGIYDHPNSLVNTHGNWPNL